MDSLLQIIQKYPNRPPMQRRAECFFCRTHKPARTFTLVCQLLLDKPPVNSDTPTGLQATSRQIDLCDECLCHTRTAMTVLEEL